MGEFWWTPPEGFVQGYMSWRRHEPLSSTDHMGDLHEMVVDHIGEMIGRVPVPLNDDEVVLLSGFLI